MGKVGVGLIGAGQIAQLLAAGIESCDRARLVAVCDVREDVAFARALDWGAERHYRDIEQVMSDDEVEAVVIATPNHLHAPMALASLKYGRHACTTRPMALTTAEADQIVNASRETGLVAGTLEPLFHHKPMTAAESFVASGEIGDLQSIQISAAVGSPDGGWEVEPDSLLWRFSEQKSGGGPFLFEHVQGALVAASMLAGSIEQLQAWIERTEIYPGYFVDAPATCMWHHATGGCVGSLDLTWSSELMIQSEQEPVAVELRAVGASGVLTAHLGPGRLTPGASLVMYRDGRRYDIGDVDASWTGAFDAAIAEFCDAVRGGGQLSCPPSLARQHLELTLAARESSKGNRLKRLTR